MSINITTTVTIWEPTKSTRLGRAVDRIYHNLHDDGSSGNGRRHEIKKTTSFASENKKELHVNHPHVLGQNQQASLRLTECKNCTGRSHQHQKL